MILDHATGSLDLSHCRVMAIVNRTPDSFYDGGRMELGAVLEHALKAVDEGADIVDLGAVRAGPGAQVSQEEETDRLIPLVEAVRARVDVPISVETSRPSIARSAFEAGASILNDVTALADEELAGACADAGGALIVMHHGGQVRGRPRAPRYDDVVEAVTAGWGEAISVAERGGVRRSSILVDPGLDFGKNTFHSLELLRRLPELVLFGFPVLVAASRKDVVGETLALPVGERLEGSLAVAALAVAAGAVVLRAHDVRATARVAAMAEAVMGRRRPAAPIRGLWD